jgi:hypothetical protein
MARHPDETIQEEKKRQTHQDVYSGFETHWNAPGPKISLFVEVIQVYTAAFKYGNI